MAKILQLKITLKNIEPKIWRRFSISDFWTFDKLHKIIQKVMSWENYHLFEFKFGDIKIISPDEGYLEENESDPKKVQIRQYVNKEKQKFEYVYDFGDSWEHEIIVEKIIEDKIEDADKYPKCIGGERACPPEDYGGVSGYEELGEDFDSEKFDIKEVNKKL